MWNNVDILLTSNPTLFLEKPKDKIVVKFNTTYNKQIESDYEINSLSEFKNTLEKIENENLLVELNIFHFSNGLK